MSNGTPISRVGKIEGTWYKEVINGMGYKQWVACDASLGNKITQVSQDDLNLRLVNRETMAVNKLLHLVNGILPDDFIAYLRHEAETITGHKLADGMVVKANGDVVEVSVHINFLAKFVSRSVGGCVVSGGFGEEFLREIRATALLPAI